MAKKSVIIRVHPEFKEVLRRLQEQFEANGKWMTDPDITLDLSMKMRKKKLV